MRKRKRHTARRVASVRSAVLSWPGWGYPRPGDLPVMTWPRGTLSWGTSSLHPDLARVLHPGWGVPPSL